MNNQKILSQIMLKLSSIYPQGEIAFKTQEKLTGYMNELSEGLQENDLANIDFLKFAFKRMRARNSAFYPSVGEFVAACMPLPEDYNLPTPQDAFNQASKVSGSHLKHTLTPLVYMAALHYWGDLGAGKGFKSYCVRYESMFNEWVRGKLVLITPPVPIAAPEKKAVTEQEKMVGNETMTKLLGGLNELQF